MQLANTRQYAEGREDFLERKYASTEDTFTRQHDDYQAYLARVHDAIRTRTQARFQNEQDRSTRAIAASQAQLGAWASNTVVYARSRLTALLSRLAAGISALERQVRVPRSLEHSALLSRSLSLSLSMTVSGRRKLHTAD